MNLVGRRAVPLLSVMVPIHNVAPYLAASLDSILRQRVRGGVEVVLVDDASTDGSTQIARDYASVHDSVVLIELPENRGVSFARNTGVERCSGELLTFVDPDDVLPDSAWRPLLKALRRTGSDFAVGKAERVGDKGRFVTPLMRRNHEVERLGIRLDDAPLLLADVFLWNKVFRRSFWDEAAITFPVGHRYEDQVAMTGAFLAARSFDVLTDVVYDWHYRSDLSSESQRRSELSAVMERRATKQMTLDQVRNRGSAAVLDTLLRQVLPIDMWEHYRAALTAGPEYWEELRAMQREIWNADGVPFERVALPSRQRLMGVLVDQDRLEDLATLIAWIDGGAAGPMPFSDDPSIPPAVFA